MGSFDPLAEIRYLAQCMKPDDRLIIDGEIYDEQQTWRGATIRRCGGSCRRCWRASASRTDDGEIKFNHKRDERHAGLHLITRYFRAERDLSATVAGQEIPLRARRADRPELPVHLHGEAFDWLLTSRADWKS